MSFLLLGDLEEAADFNSTWLDLVGDIRIIHEELDVIVTVDDDGREDEYLVCNREDGTDDVIIGEDDVRASEEDVSTVESKTEKHSQWKCHDTWSRMIFYLEITILKLRN